MMELIEILAVVVLALVAIRLAIPLIFYGAILLTVIAVLIGSAIDGAIEVFLR